MSSKKNISVNKQRLTKDFNELLVELGKSVKSNDIAYECDGNFDTALENSLKNMTNFTILLRGPSDTPYSGGKFRLRVEIQGDYPWKPPVVTFETKIYHPNVRDKSICLDTLSSSWSPIITLSHLILSISALLCSPNGGDPLSANIGAEFRDNYQLFKKNAIEHTIKYAIKDERRDYMKIDKTVANNTKTSTIYKKSNEYDSGNDEFEID
jgi:ubiquitin-conjugating enzyme E2 D/E